MDIRLAASPGEAAEYAGRWMAARIHEAIRRTDRANLAFSGGSTAPDLLSSIARADVPWEQVSVWQVDERVAPDGHPDRNAVVLSTLPSAVQVHPMPVTDGDLVRAAADYATELPEVFDVVHLGVGDDGHTASWPPGDSVVESDRRVDLSGSYQGRVRMTLTPSVVNASRCRLVYVLGRSKAEAMSRWLLGDDSLPIGLVDRTNTVVVLDAEAGSLLPQ